MTIVATVNNNLGVCEYGEKCDDGSRFIILWLEKIIPEK